MSDDFERGLRDLLEQRGHVDAATQGRVVESISRLPDRQPRRPIAGPVSIAAAIVVVAIIGLASAVSTRPPTILTPSASTSTAPSATLPTSSPGPTIQPRPVWAKDLASHLDCDGPVSSIGMDVPAIPDPLEPATTPDGALENFLIDHPSLRPSLFGDPFVVGHWALHRHIANGRPKVHIVSTNQFPDVPEESRWQVVGIRACDPSEF